MWDKAKKLTTLAVALVLTGATMAGCGSTYKQPVLSETTGEVASNGGFVVKKGEYVYFINGIESNTANNTYGEVVKGSLMRIKESDLPKLGTENAVAPEMVVSSLFVSENYDSGFYIYGDTVYFATPTTEKNRDGSIANDYISFKSANIYGKSSEKELKKYFFRSSNNATEFHFVEIDGTVYCMYVDGKELHSFNTKSGKDTLLVSGAEKYYFDNTALNGKAYYTMSVVNDVDTANTVEEKYNQVYSVTADATVTVDKANASYTASGYTYTFDKTYLTNNLNGFDPADYTTYPYVNLGTLVLDGIGNSLTPTMYNHDVTETTKNTALNGFTYTIVSYENDGLYFTRKESDTEKLYYLAESKMTNSVTANNEVAFYAKDTTNASASAIFVDATNYLYVDGENIVKATVEGTTTTTTIIGQNASSATLMFVDGDYLYYAKSGAVDKNIFRLNYTGSATDYSKLQGKEEYKALQILDVDYTSTWYAPELIDGYLFYPNAQSFGGKSYNYVNVVNMNGASGVMTYDELKAFNDKYTEVQDAIEEYCGIASEYETLEKTLNYYFRTGKLTAYEEFLAEAKDKGYNDEYRYTENMKKEIKAFAEGQESVLIEGKNFADIAGYNVESYYYNMLGQMNTTDKEAVEKSWKSANFIEPLPEPEVEKVSYKALWITLGCVVGGLALITAVAVPVIMHNKKKAKLQAMKEATAVRKPRLDTTDDKSIDVYATEEEPKQEAENTVEETEEKTE